MFSNRFQRYSICFTLLAFSDFFLNYYIVFCFALLYIINYSLSPQKELSNYIELRNHFLIYVV